MKRAPFLGTLLLCPLFLWACAQKDDARIVLERPVASSTPSPWVKARSPEGLPLLEAPATLVTPPEAEAWLSPPLAARVVRSHVRVGDRVEVDGPVLDVVMPEAVSAAGRLVAANARIEAQEKRKAQLASLAEHGMALLSDRAEAEAALGEARAERLAANSLLQAAGLSASEAARLVSQGGIVTLRSPIAGVLVSLNAPLGATWEAGGKPLARIAGFASGRVVARIQGAIPEGATLSFVSGLEDPIPLAVVSASPVIDPRDGSRELFLEPSRPISPGATGRLIVKMPEEGQEAVAIPSLALFLEDGAAYVFERVGDEVKEVPVKVLSSSGTDALVTGIPLGAEVAADAVHFGAGKPEGGGHH